MTQLYPYQRSGVRRIHWHGGRALLGDDMGLGKSIQSAGYYYKHLYPDAPMVIVCPGNVKWNWQNEISTHFGERSEVLETTRPPHGGLGVAQKCGVYIINYDILYAWADWLIRLRPIYIIGDEGHRLKNPLARWTKAFRRIARIIPHIVINTGTPQISRPAELWSLCNMIWPEKYPSFIEFGDRYCEPKAKFGRIVYEGAANLPELNRRLNEDGLIRRKKCDVLKDLPKKSRIVVTVSVDDYKKYREAMVIFRKWAGGNPEWRSKHGAEGLTYVGNLKRLAAILKLPSVIEWVEDFLAEDSGKLIVFGIHKAVLKPLHTRFPGSVLIDGSVVGRMRQTVVDQFTHDKNTRLAIVNNVAGGLGWNGIVANTTCTVELPWEPATCNQCEGRVDRIGQTKPVSCYYLVARGTIEEPLCEIIQKKQRLADTVIDGGLDMSGLSVFNELVDKITRNGK